MALSGKNILLGITGGIAAYKSAFLVRLLVRRGANVKVIMTPAAKQFIAPLTFATLSQNPVLTEFFNPENGEWNSHVRLGLWADAMIIAPATANTIGKMANGIADNLLTTSYLSVKCPVFVAPAMDLDMYNHQATQRNIATLKAAGNIIIDAENGELASGLSGKGRMAEPETILETIENKLLGNSDLCGKTIMITAGPTYEKIDPVRFIGNCSSGKMGFALAHAAACRGANVVLISGPTHLSVDNSKITRINVESAEQMLAACSENFGKCDVAILAAAVADYRPKFQYSQKIKKTESAISLELESTPDIACTLGKRKRDGQLLIGFALETENLQANARQKLRKKNFDFIVLNNANEQGAGFNSDTNHITIIRSDEKVVEFEMKDKLLVANDILDQVAAIMNINKK